MPTEARKPWRRPRVLLAGAALVAVLVAGFGVAGRAYDVHAMQKWSDARAVPAVSLVRPASATAGQALVLPGTLQAFNAAQIYPRVSGYVKAWYEDIGAPVKAGQLLAVIDTPELDQQIAQAQADLASAQASRKLAQSTAARWNDLLSSEAVSKQEADEKNGDLQAKTALVNAAEADVRRLMAMKGFARITAPFDGKVTARNADIGALVNAGAGGQTTSLFTVSDVHRIRIYVRTPQSDAALLKPGMTASLTMPDYPGRTFTATLVSTSGAINDQSGAMLVELQSDNAGGLLRPGGYAQVRFSLPSSGPGTGDKLLLPASALMFRKNGLQVAVLGPGDRARLRSISISEDLGSQVQVSGGLTASDRVIDNPPDSLSDGDPVRVAKPARGA